MLTKHNAIDFSAILANGTATVPVPGAPNGKQEVSVATWDLESFHHVFLHGLKQLLGDAAAGKSGLEAEKAIQEKANRLASQGFRMGARSGSDPVLREMAEIAIISLKSLGLKGKVAWEWVRSYGPTACQVACQRQKEMLKENPKGPSLSESAIRLAQDEVTEEMEQKFQAYAQGIIEKRLKGVSL